MSWWNQIKQKKNVSLTGSSVVLSCSIRAAHNTGSLLCVHIFSTQYPWACPPPQTRWWYCNVKLSHSATAAWANSKPHFLTLRTRWSFILVSLPFLSCSSPTGWTCRLMFSFPRRMPSWWLPISSIFSCPFPFCPGTWAAPTLAKTSTYSTMNSHSSDDAMVIHSCSIPPLLPFLLSFISLSLQHSIVLVN